MKTDLGAFLCKIDSFLEGKWKQKQIYHRQYFGVQRHWTLIKEELIELLIKINQFGEEFFATCFKGIGLEGFLHPDWKCHCLFAWEEGSPVTVETHPALFQWMGALVPTPKQFFFSKSCSFQKKKQKKKTKKKQQQQFGHFFGWKVLRSPESNFSSWQCDSIQNPNPVSEPVFILTTKLEVKGAASKHDHETRHFGHAKIVAGRKRPPAISKFNVIKCFWSFLQTVVKSPFLAPRVPSKGKDNSILHKFFSRTKMDPVRQDTQPEKASWTAFRNLLFLRFSFCWREPDRVWF